MHSIWSLNGCDTTDRKILTSPTEAMFSCQKNLQNFSDFPSHRIFGHTYKTLNIDKK
jgi:hypothetical protein